MDNSEVFKSAHAMAKAALVKMGGDYAAYFSHYLKVVFSARKRTGKSNVQMIVNSAISFCGAPIVFRMSARRAVFSLHEFDCWLTDKGFGRFASECPERGARATIKAGFYRGSR